MSEPEAPYVREELYTQAWVTRSVLVSNDCTGSPNCAVEIQIQEHSGSYKWQEAHLTRAEAEQLMEWIRAALGPAPASVRPARRRRFRWWG